MGICSSCLNRRGHDSYSSQERANLLPSDHRANAEYPHGGGRYGALMPNHGSSSSVVPENPEDREREIRALARILANTSDNLIDIYALDTQPSVNSPHIQHSSTVRSNVTVSSDEAVESAATGGAAAGIESKEEKYMRLLARTTGKYQYHHHGNGSQKQKAGSSGRSAGSIRGNGAEREERLKREAAMVRQELERANAGKGLVMDLGRR